MLFRSHQSDIEKDHQHWPQICPPPPYIPEIFLSFCLFIEADRSSLSFWPCLSIHKLACARAGAAERVHQSRPSTDRQQSGPQCDLPPNQITPSPVSAGRGHGSSPPLWCYEKIRHNSSTSKSRNIPIWISLHLSNHLEICPNKITDSSLQPKKYTL